MRPTPYKPLEAPTAYKSPYSKSVASRELLAAARRMEWLTVLRRVGQHLAADLAHALPRTSRGGVQPRKT
jgi:hypothetical protein